MGIKVSVVITAFNVEKYIEECVRSVLNQTLFDIEIICVDDYSEDNTREVLHKLQNEDDRIKLILNQSNKGLAFSRLRGYAESKGEFLYIMDGDDVLAKNAMERLCSVSENYDLDLVSFSGQAFFDDLDMEKAHRKDIDYYIRKGKYPDEPIKGIDLLELYYGYGDFTGNIVFQFIRKRVIDDERLIALDGLKYGESPLALYLKAKRTMCISDILYFRRFRKNSDITTPYNQAKIESIIVQYDFDYTYYCQNTEDKDNNRALIWDSFYRRVRQIVSLVSDHPINDENMTVLQKYPSASFLYTAILKRMDVKEMYCELLTENALDKIKTYKDIFVYGNGLVASYVKEKLAEEGIENYKIVTTEGSESTVDKVYSVDEITDYCKVAIIIVAIAAPNKINVIASLREKGFLNILEVSRA